MSVNDSIKTETPDMDAAPASDILSNAGLRPTRQRLALAKLLFGERGRHVSVDSLYDELVRSGAPGSLSCVYNSLRRFSEIGLVRRVPVYGSTAYFDTRLNHHHHFYAVDEDRLIDVSADAVALAAVPSPPQGYELVSIDVLLRVRRADAGAAAG
jgi:Fur family iron response transcriptional regulator